MSATPLTALIARCRALCRPRLQVDDVELVRRLVQQHDANAFEELLERYAPLVWGVCRRMLANEADCEDAFQAAFLAFVRKPPALPSPQLGKGRGGTALGGWLHTVAVRIAHKAQAQARRQRPQAVLPEQATASDVADEVSSRELFRLVDEEIERLPALLRQPLLLCCLEGRTRDEAAEALGCSVAAVKSRLARGRDMLRRRLTRRGVELPAAFLVLGLTSEGIRAALWAKTMKTALYTPAPALAALAEAGLPSVTMAKGKLIVAALLLAFSAASAAGFLLTTKTPEPPPTLPAKSAAETSRPKSARVRTDRHGDPLPDGAIARLGTVRWRHGFYVHALAYSPNGKMIAAVGAGRALTLWDAASGKEILQFPNRDQPNSLAFSPDGKILATVGSVCRLWDIATGKELRQLIGHQNAVLRVVFSPDGKRVATASADCTVRLWDPDTGEEKHCTERGSALVCGLAFSPDGKRLASSNTDGTIHLWDPATGKKQHQLTGHKKGVWNIVFSPDGKWLASSSDDGTVRLWDPATGRQVRTIGEKLGGSIPIAFSPDGTLLALAHRDGMIRLWDMAAGAEKRRWQASAITVLAIAFSPDGKTLASEAYWESIRFWDVATGRERHPSEEHLGSIDLVRFAPEGASLVSISCDQRLLWWDLATQTHCRHFSWSNKEPSEMLSLIALSPDGNTLAVRHRAGYELRLWDTRTGKQGRLLGKHQNKISEIAYSLDSRLVAYAEDEHVIHIWDVRDGKEVWQMKGFTSHAMKLCFSPDGKALACGRWEGGKPSLRLWDMASGKDRCAFQCVDPIGALAFSPEGKVLATGAINRPGDSLIRLWDTASGKELGRHKGHPDPIQAIAFSPDGKLVASGAGFIRDWHNTLHVWEVATGRLLRCFEGHLGFVTSVAFSPDGLVVASGGSDSTILLWDITGRRADGRWHIKPLSPRELDGCWTALASEDAAKAYDAVWKLVAAPKQSVPFLRKRLTPVPIPDAKRVAQRLAELDSDDFTTRQRAAAELSKFGDAIIPALQRALDHKPALEVRRRVQHLLDQARDWTGERLRDHRAIQALEYIGTPPAREVLQALAAGVPKTLRTEEAKAALQRLHDRDKIKEKRPR